MKNLTWQNPEQLFVAQELINKVKSKCCGIKVYERNGFKTLLPEEDDEHTRTMYFDILSLDES